MRRKLEEIVQGEQAVGRAGRQSAGRGQQRAAGDPALVSARNSPQAWDLRCEVREKMIVFLQEHYPKPAEAARLNWSSLNGCAANG